MDGAQAVTERKGTLRQTAAAVFWSFFGVRKSKDHEADMARLNPVHVIIMGIVGAAIFVATLLIIVNIIVG